jgi:hypothetical protein
LRGPTSKKNHKRRLIECLKYIPGRHETVSSKPSAAKKPGKVTDVFMQVYILRNLLVLFCMFGTSSYKWDIWVFSNWCLWSQCFYNQFNCFWSSHYFVLGRLYNSPRNWYHLILLVVRGCCLHHDHILSAL